MITNMYAAPTRYNSANVYATQTSNTCGNCSCTRAYGTCISRSTSSDSGKVYILYYTSWSMLEPGIRPKVFNPKAHLNLRPLLRTKIKNARKDLVLRPSIQALAMCIK